MGLSVSDFTIDNASGQAVRLDIQACFKALQGQNAESADSDMASSQCVAGMTFLNTTTDILKVRNSSNNGFTDIGNIDQTNLGLLPRSGGSAAPMTGQLFLDDTTDKTAPALTFDGNANLGLFKRAANQMCFVSNNAEQVLIDQNGLTLQGQGDLRFADADSSNYVGFQAPATIGTSLTWTLPAADAAVSGYALVSDASGTLSWAAAGGGAVGGGSDEIFWENDQTVTQDYTITNGHNAGSFGPIEIQSGVTVTVGAGETWTVV